MAQEFTQALTTEWVELPKCRFCKSPTNWAEWFAGLVIGYGLY